MPRGVRLNNEACLDQGGYDAGDRATGDRGDKIIGKGPPTVEPKQH